MKEFFNVYVSLTMLTRCAAMCLFLRSNLLSSFSILQVFEKYLRLFWMCSALRRPVFFSPVFFQNNFREMGNFMRQENITSRKFVKPIWIYRLLSNIICRKKNLNAFCFRSVVLFRSFFASSTGPSQHCCETSVAETAKEGRNEERQKCLRFVFLPLFRHSSDTLSISVHDVNYLVN